MKFTCHSGPDGDSDDINNFTKKKKHKTFSPFPISEKSKLSELPGRFKDYYSSDSLESRFYFHVFLNF